MMQETNALRAKRRCKKCGTAMDSYLIDPNVNCTSAVITRPAMDMRSKGEFRIKGYDGLSLSVKVWF